MWCVCCPYQNQLEVLLELASELAVCAGKFFPPKNYHVAQRDSIEALDPSFGDWDESNRNFISKTCMNRQFTTITSELAALFRITWNWSRSKDIVLGEWNYWWCTFRLTQFSGIWSRFSSIFYFYFYLQSSTATYKVAAPLKKNK